MSTHVEESGLGFRIVDDVVGPLTGRQRSAADAWKAAGLEPDTQLSEPADDRFNPTDHKVDDVVAYLVAADEGERTRVIALEAAGKARVGITGWAPAQGDDDTED